RDRTVTGVQTCALPISYNLAAASANNGVGQTIAIVDAFDDPRAESDLAVYRSQFGLPPCTTANGCFRKVNQSGGTRYPRGNSGRSEEHTSELQSPYDLV